MNDKVIPIGPYLKESGEMSTTSANVISRYQNILAEPVPSLNDSLRYREDHSDRTPFVEEETEEVVARSTQKVISTDTLYPNLEKEGSLSVDIARRKLAKARNLLDSALRSIRAQMLVEADNDVMFFSSLLPELFCFRHLGDGFGAAINGMYFSIRNRKGMHLEEKQLETMRKLVSYIYNHPFLSFEDAASRVLQLETVGLNPLPPELDFLADVTE